MPMTVATTIRKTKYWLPIIDSPCAETKKTVPYLYVVDCKTLANTVAVANNPAEANTSCSSHELCRSAHFFWIKRGNMA